MTCVHQDRRHSCDGCRWYHSWFGICVNGDAKDPGGTPDKRCELYKPSEEEDDEKKD